MANNPVISIRATMAWWLKPYLFLLAWFCVMTGMQPDMQKLERTIARAIKMKVVA